MFNKNIGQPSAILWLFSFLKPYKNRIFLVFSLLLIGSGTWLFIGQGIKGLIDKGFDTKQNFTFVLILLISVIYSISVYFRFFLLNYLAEKVSADIRVKLYNHLLELSPSFFAKTRTGEVISRFTTDITLLQTIIGSSASMALTSCMTALGGIIMMALTDFYMMLLVMFVIFIIVFPIKLLSKKIRVFSRINQDKNAVLSAYLDETVHEIRTVQAYGHEPKDKKLFEEYTDDVILHSKTRIVYQALLVSLIILVFMLSIILITLIGISKLMSGTITSGELSAFLFYAILVSNSTGTISQVIGDIQRIAGAAERLMELDKTECEIVQPKNVNDLPEVVAGNIAISNIQFSYPSTTSNTLVLKNISLNIKAGERVALVGSSGSGKSTLIALLQRFYLPNSGCIKLDGIDIKKLKLSALRSQFALVPQEAVIFSTTILENVRYGRINATKDEVRRACITAQIDQFISEQPNGYETHLGERGIMLSVGQKQRISIARAILANRPILLLDEATSALDAKIEDAVKQALDALMRGKTSIVIAHRLSTVMNADRIVVIDKGKIIDCDTHDNLTKNNEIYKEFVQLQAGIAKSL